MTLTSFESELQRLLKLSQPPTFIPPPFNQFIGSETKKDTPVHKRPLIGLEGRYIFSMKDWIERIYG